MTVHNFSTQYNTLLPRETDNSYCKLICLQAAGNCKCSTPGFVSNLS